MVQDNTPVDDYDPDAPPEQEPFEFTGKLLQSKRLNNSEEAHAAGCGTNYDRYIEASGRPKDTPVWFLQAEALDGERANGDPFLQSDIVPLKSSTGKWLTEGQAPDQIAQQYREVTSSDGAESGLTASYRAEGQPNSAVGRIFHFVEEEIKLGKSGKFTKRVSLWPVELLAVDATVEQTKEYPAPKEDNAGGAEIEAPADASPDEVLAVAKTLSGKTRDQVFDAIMNDTGLKNISRVLGHDLIAAATEDKLVDLLVDAGHVTISDSGIITLASA